MRFDFPDTWAILHFTGQIHHTRKVRRNITMSRKLYPTNVVKQAKSVLDAWNRIEPDLAFGALNTASISSDLCEAATILSQITSLEKQLLELRNRRDALYVSMWNKVKRVRSGMLSEYGDDSLQYELVGGTRLSKRKPYKRRSGSL
jgi:hypothetical protein